MKLFYYLFIIILVNYTNSKAQNLIIVQNGSAVKIYNQLQSAIDSANVGDTIYISGISWPAGLNINKTLHLFGNGYNPDSVTLGLTSIIQGSLNFLQGSENSTISGFNIKGGIIFNVNGSIDNIHITRCRFTSLYLNSNITNVIVSGCIFENTSQNNNTTASNCGFLNNVFLGVNYSNQYTTTSDCIFKNNIFLANSGCNFGCSWPLITNNSIIENNIFINVSQFHSIQGTSNIANNNLFVENWTLSTCNCQGINNIVNQPQGSIFVNQNGNNYDYSHDYHLKVNSAGKNAGTDETDIGIYGGTFPWKDGSLPLNPHIQFKSIAGSTDQNGNLKVDIKVKAQNN